MLTAAPQHALADMMQLLEDHHLVLLGGGWRQREEAAAQLHRHLRDLPETQVVAITGTRVVDLRSFCGELLRSRVRSRRRAARRARFEIAAGLPGLLRWLRAFDGDHGAGSRVKRRMFLWCDADRTVQRNRRLFCQLCNALFTVAAEREYIRPGMLVLERLILVGGEALSRCVEDERGGFARWIGEGPSEWITHGFLRRPPVLTYRLET